MQYTYCPMALNLAYYKNKLYKTLDYWSRDNLNFDILEKGLGIVSSPHFVYDFSIKMFLMLYFIIWPNFIVWWPLLLKILGNMYIGSVCYPVCDVITFEINLAFLIKPFFYLTKQPRQKLNILRTKKLLRPNKKHFFIIFKGRVQINFSKLHRENYMVKIYSF